MIHGTIDGWVARFSVFDDKLRKQNVQWKSLKGFTSLMQWRGYAVRPFTPQENTVVQTCAVAGAAIAFSAGFGSSITGTH